MSDELVIAQRFCGPPESGNGGYACGRVALHLTGAARVRLHRPPPLERALRVERMGSEVRVLDGDALVATGLDASLEGLELPRIPSLDAAREATERYVAASPSAHVFPTCFVCGPARAPGDGLRIFAGAIEDGIVAAPFEPSADLLDVGGRLRPEIVWAALDCPGYFAIVGERVAPMLLGELTVEIRAPIAAGPRVVLGWSIGQEGRKARCGTALASPDGEVLAVGTGTWIRIG